jgi:ABC-2 type transport system permease protein
MRFWKSWIVTSKDLAVFKKNRYILYSLIALPVIMGVVLPVIYVFSIQAVASQMTHSELLAAADQIVSLISTFLILIPAVLPSIIASYSFVGEKIERSLEPLLATPTTDGELLLGKSLASFLPCIGVTYLAATISLVIIDAWSVTQLGVLLLPNAYWAVALGLVSPLACVMSVEANVIVSSRVNDIRAAQQIGSLVVLPLIFLVIFAITGVAGSTFLLGLVVAGALAIADGALFFLAKATFQREEILTKWK